MKQQLEPQPDISRELFAGACAAHKLKERKLSKYFQQQLARFGIQLSFRQLRRPKAG